VPRSVTGLVKTFSAEFDAARAAEQMMASARWLERRADFETEGGPPATSESVAAQWRLNGEVQRARGTLLHYQADQLLQGRAWADQSPELQQVGSLRDFMVDHLGLSLWRTEVCIFNCGWQLAGTPDFLLKDRHGDVVIVDWKRTQDVPFESRFRCMGPPLEHLPDSKGWLYALQLNLYAAILEGEYGLRVSTLYLALVHPGLRTGRLIQLPRLDEEIGLLFECEVAEGRASEQRPGELAPF
jgi:PD-(D/E)XK nuclease superfamily